MYSQRRTSIFYYTESNKLQSAANISQYRGQDRTVKDTTANIKLESSSFIEYFRLYTYTFFFFYFILPFFWPKYFTASINPSLPTFSKDIFWSVKRVFLYFHSIFIIHSVNKKKERKKLNLMSRLCFKLSSY